MNQFDLSVTRSHEAVQATNKVLRNTYLLLSMTLLCSAVTAGISMALGLGPGSALVLSLVGFGMIFWVHKAARPFRETRLGRRCLCPVPRSPL